MAKMFLMTGPCGAGKSTLAKELARERGLRLLAIDDFYAAFFNSELIHEHRDEVWEAFSFAIRAAMEDDIDILIDTNAPSSADRNWFIERFPDFDFNLVIVEAPKDLCFENNRNRSRTIPDDEMDMIFDRLEPVTEDEMEKYSTVELYRNTDNTGVKFVKKLR